MYRHLPIFSLVIALLFFTFNTSAFASTTTTKKEFHAYWQLLTLKQVLTVQANTLGAGVTLTPSATEHTITVTPTLIPIKPGSTKISVPTGTISQPVSVTIISPTQPQPTQPTQPAPTTNDVTSYIMGEINAYRASQGLGAVHTNDETCSFAKIRAGEITTSFSHDGFNSRVSNHTLPYAHWTSVTENIAMTSDYKQVENMWQNSPGHAENMRADTPFVCVIQNGNYFAYEGMKP